MNKNPTSASRAAGQDVPRWLTRGAAIGWRLLVLGVLAASVVWSVARIRLVVLPLIAGLLIATVLVPPQRWLIHRRWPPLAATWTVVVLGLAVIGALGMWLIPAIVGQASQLGSLLTNGLSQIQEWLVKGPLHLSSNQVKSFVDQLRSEFSTNSATIIRGALRGTQLAIEAVAAAVLTVVFTFFIVKDGEELAAEAVKLAGDSFGPHLAELGYQSWQMLGSYVRGMAVNGLVNGSLMAIVLLVTGVPLVVPLASATFLSAFLPIVGAIAVGGLAALVALAAKGWVTSLTLVGATIVIHHVEAYLVGPLVLGRAVRLRPLSIVIALALGASIAGLIGAALAVPIAALAINLFSHQWNPPQGSEEQVFGIT